jgi:hypothetical protein
MTVPTQRKRHSRHRHWIMRRPLSRGGRYGQIDGRVASEDYSSEAPTEPDVQVFRIRLFGSRFRYATIAERM